MRPQSGQVSRFVLQPARSGRTSRSGELFLHRVVISRSAGPQLQGGDPGFVKLTGPSSLEFPDYDANFMYRTLGNITKNPKIGLLFMAFDRKTYRIRINGRASARGDAESLGRHCGAKAVIRVECLAYTRIVRAMYQTSRQAKARSTCRVPVKRRPRRNGKGCLPPHRSFRMRTGKARPMVARRVNDGAMQHQAQTGLPEGVPR